MAFAGFVSERGPPYRSTDLFDDVGPVQTGRNGDVELLLLWSEERSGHDLCPVLTAGSQSGGADTAGGDQSSQSHEPRQGVGRAALQKRTSLTPHLFFLLRKNR